MSILSENRPLATLWKGVLEYYEITMCHEIPFVILAGRRTLGVTDLQQQTIQANARVVRLMFIFYMVAWSAVSTAPISTCTPILLA